MGWSWSANMKKLIAWSVCFVLASSMVGCKKKSIGGATKENPFVNSLGMEFVRVPGTKVLFSIWDTRAKDYRAYAAANPEVDESWRSLGFEQEEDHPVVDVDWEDANAFCSWLMKKERQEGKIGQDQEYRLPTDKEWSAAVGTDRYPWGNQWPPPEGAGNYNPSLKVDNYEHTSPVGSFGPNQCGLYDMGGNVWQWCKDWYRSEMNEKAVLDKYPGLKNDGGGQQYRLVRGAFWGSDVPESLLSSVRLVSPNGRFVDYGFRCVLGSVSSSH